ncbi:MAG: Gfo/Idh/MocA family oxidoreductase [Sedimentisphaerales bacterium]|nr:Gfo/Idh/MocA family oxidoreductase [Sedimentisphaerales bacterium]
MKKTNFSIIGSGWRAEFFLRVAKELPEQFEVTGIVVRNQAKGRIIEKNWAIRTFRTIDEMFAETEAEFVVVSVPRDINPQILRKLALGKIPVLVETSPAVDLDGLIEVWKLTQSGARIQVAEQYIYQPGHAGRLNIVNSGWLGQISQAQISAAHGYHGVSLIRNYLGVGFQKATITTKEFEAKLIAGPGRDGPPKEERLISSSQVIAYLDFGDKLGIYDFVSDQYFSWIRSNRVLVRGRQGEINNNTVRYLLDYKTPIELELRRVDAGQTGNLEGYFHKGILAGDRWIYRNEFTPARLADDEIAVATCLKKMAEYVRGGSEFYSVAQAAQDTYVAILIEKAVQTKQKIIVEPQPWVV